MLLLLLLLLLIRGKNLYGKLKVQFLASSKFIFKHDRKTFSWVSFPCSHSQLIDLIEHLTFNFSRASTTIFTAFAPQIRNCQKSWKSLFKIYFTKKSVSFHLLSCDHANMASGKIRFTQSKRWLSSVNKLYMGHRVEIWGHRGWICKQYQISKFSFRRDCRRRY